MIYLKNGCARSVISVTPKNWKTAQASVKRKWKISYRYYDPAFSNDPKKWGKQFTLRGMNRFIELCQRKDATMAMVERLVDILDNQLLNPITKAFLTQVEHIEEITPDTQFISALKQAHKLIRACEEMKKDIMSVISTFQTAASKLYDNTYRKPYTALKIAQVSRKHLVYLLSQCGKDNPDLSAQRQNRYRSYLIMLFKELLRVEAVGANPAKDLAIDHSWVRKKRKILDETEALIIDTNLRAWDYYFWRYMRIFFRSGSRSTEMYGLKPEHVSLSLQEFTVLVKKGKRYVEDTRPIPDDVLPLWIEVMQETGPSDYLFSTSFKPGPGPVYKDSATKKWKKYVKNDPGVYDPYGHGWGLGIKKDFYSLKHRNADKTEEQLDTQHAQEAMGHTNEKTTGIYTVNKKKRTRENLKKTEIKFV